MLVFFFFLSFLNLGSSCFVVHIKRETECDFLYILADVTKASGLFYLGFCFVLFRFLPLISRKANYLST